jgi:type II secretory pathway pseudopilin PulG
VHVGEAKSRQRHDFWIPHAAHGRAGAPLAQLPAVTSKRQLRGERGFTLIEALLMCGLAAVVAAMAVPSFRNMTESMRLGQGAREVERELQAARLKAVTSNRVLRVRFNCPSAGQYRMVELIGTPSVPATADGATNRCSETMYPFPAVDRDLMTLPNLDGPVRRLHSSVSFGAVKTLEFRPGGTVHADTGAAGAWPELPSTGTAITVTKGVQTRSITVNGLGKIQLQ